MNLQEVPSLHLLTALLKIMLHLASLIKTGQSFFMVASLCDLRTRMLSSLTLVKETLVVVFLFLDNPDSLNHIFRLVLGLQKQFMLRTMFLNQILS